MKIKLIVLPVYSVRMYGVTFQMIDTEVCILPEDVPEIRSKRVVGRHETQLILDCCVGLL
jgi:hypothetical protein